MVGKVDTTICKDKNEMWMRNQSPTYSKLNGPGQLNSAASNPSGTSNRICIYLEIDMCVLSITKDFLVEHG